MMARADSNMGGGGEIERKVKERARKARKIGESQFPWLRPGFLWLLQYALAAEYLTLQGARSAESPWEGEEFGI